LVHYGSRQTLDEELATRLAHLSNVKPFTPEGQDDRHSSPRQSQALENRREPRIGSQAVDHVVDDTWASWALPSRVCFGDSGGATFFNAQPLSRPFDISLVAVASDGGIDCISPECRARVDKSAVRRWIVETIQQHVSGLPNPANPRTANLSITVPG